ncbi:SDR family NAD(P)-dependent oxidoreductase [Marinicella gelatinilytica]|uniref:SDR family NAD(P)-dependent oxidoreductase n=1 Tax=Marinicella gelatinilytica TaxID=2996017 RepID=UPI002260DAFF|nr:SDR family NAD(P)-dependent oxidoreductase [Marinicella gelatinilytica]MCX7543817.1 SDR family NAD(P)-dependent oxidoreductase [Marinicella gelatinilytica]
MGQTKYALITGASAGLGACFAQQLAQRGWSLILIARRTDRLQQLAQQLQHQHNIDAQIITADLAQADAAQKIYQHCQTQQWSVAMLVNNAGYGLPGDFDEPSWPQHQAQLNVMLNSLVELTYLFYPAMKKARYGRIIQVASLAGLAPPTAGHTLYAPMKSFVIKFAHSLHLEGKDFGVHVSALCPGFTYTEFHDANGTRHRMNKLSKSLWMSADEVVAEGIAAVEANKAVKINGWRNQLIALMTRLLPDKIIRALFQKNINKYRKRSNES